MLDSTPNPLTRRLSEHELNLLQVIARPHLEWGAEWPVWDFVERTMYEEFQVDARTILNGLPRLKERFAISGYGLVHPTVWAAPHPIPTDPNDRLQLTVAGLSQLGGQSATSRVTAIVEIVANLARLELSVRPDPSKPVTAQSSWQEIQQTLSTMMDRQIGTPRRYSPEWPVSVESILRHEPAMWRCNGEGDFDLHSDFRYFRGLATDDGGADYLDRTWQYIEPPEPVTLPEPVSALAVHEALDYLDIFLRLSADPAERPGPSTLSIGKLAVPCASRLEFDDRISALVDALSSIDVPRFAPSLRKIGPTLDALRNHVLSKLEADAVPPIEDAIADLRAVAAIRHSKEHSDAAARAPDAYLQLGVPWPISDWSVAWNSVLASTIAALNIIREELRRGL